MTYCRLFHEAGLQPLSDAIQVQVDAHQAQLPSPLDQLVGLHHQPLEETINKVLVRRTNRRRRLTSTERHRAHENGRLVQMGTVCDINVSVPVTQQIFYCFLLLFNQLPPPP